MPSRPSPRPSARRSTCTRSATSSCSTSPSRSRPSRRTSRSRTGSASRAGCSTRRGAGALPAGRDRRPAGRRRTPRPTGTARRRAWWAGTPPPPVEPAPWCCGTVRSRRFVVSGGVVTGVVTERGAIATDTVVCAAGAWSKRLGALAGVDLPVEPLRRQILTTEPIAGPRSPHPVHHRLLDLLLLPRRGAGAAGRHVRPRRDARVQAGPVEGWLERLGEAIERRAPALSSVGIRAGWAGLYEMTPDHNALVGEADGVARFLYATGFSGHGFLMGPAVGEVVRDLYLGRHPVVDVGSLSVDRFARRGPPPGAHHRVDDQATVPDDPPNAAGAPMPATMHEIPTAAALHDSPSTPRRCGVDIDAAGEVADDVPGQRRAASVDARLGRAGQRSRTPSQRAQEAFGEWRSVPAPARGALVKRLGELLAVHKDDLATADQPRGRQDHLRGPRRGPGDDRHLRLRGRPLPPALRPDDALASAPATG